MSQRELLRQALAYRTIYGYLPDNTRMALEDTGMTVAEIEAALINMEKTQ